MFCRHTEHTIGLSITGGKYTIGIYRTSFKLISISQIFFPYSPVVSQGIQKVSKQDHNNRGEHDKFTHGNNQTESLFKPEKTLFLLRSRSQIFHVEGGVFIHQSPQYIYMQITLTVRPWHNYSLSGFFSFSSRAAKETRLLVNSRAPGFTFRVAQLQAKCIHDSFWSLYSYFLPWGRLTEMWKPYHGLFNNHQMHLGDMVKI